MTELGYNISSQSDDTQPRSMLTWNVTSSGSMRNEENRK